MRKIWLVLMMLLAVTALLVVAGLWQIERSLARANIHQLDYRIESIGFHRAHFEKLAFVYSEEIPQLDAERISSQLAHTSQQLSQSSQQLPQQQASSVYLALEQVAVQWQWRRWFAPQLTLVRVKDARISRIAGASSTDVVAETSDVNLPRSWELPAFLPERIAIEKLTLNLPCAAREFCTLTGELAVHREDSTATLNMRLSPGNVLQVQQQLQLMLKYSLRENLPDLIARLVVEDDLDINLRTQLSGEKNPLLWSGTLSGQVATLDDIWRTALGEWNIHLSDKWQKSRQTISINSNWQLAFDPILAWINSPSVNPWQEALTGSLGLDIDVPVPVGIGAAGEFSGQFEGELEAADGALTHYEISAKINAEQIAIPDELRDAGIAVDRVVAALESRAEEPLAFENFNSLKNFTRLPVTVALQSFGDFNGQLVAQLRIDLAAAAVNIERASLTTKAKTISLDQGLTLNKPELTMHAHGEISPQTFSLIINKKSELKGDFHAPEFSVDLVGASISSPDFVLQGNSVQGKPQLSSVEFAGNISLAAKQLQHPQVNPTAWQWQGNIGGGREDFLLTGTLGFDSAILKHQLQRKGARATVNWQLDNVYLLAGNPLANTFTAWPELLTLSQGKINAKGNLQFDIEAAALSASDSQIALQDLKGIYDTTLFEGLGGNFRMTTQGETLTLVSDAMNIKTIDKGFILGPFEAAAHYQTELKNLTQGKLNLQRLNGRVMDGKVSIAAREFDFSQAAQTFVVDVEAIDLASLLKQYPSSELSGDGRISGKIPVTLTAQGISIDKGAVAAEPPGGRIHYESERVRKLASSQQSLQLVTKALEDFHYSVLASELSYDESGRLMLSLKLEGRNPAVENGRPINFNINIEEDLPALIASIQLGSQISDQLKKRVQERLQNRASKSQKDK